MQLTQVHKKNIKSEKYHFCNKREPFAKDCLKCKAWFKKKYKPSALVCFTSNLSKVLYNTWWINSGRTTHVSKTMHRFLMVQTININEKFIFMGNRVKAPVEGIGTYCLILDSGYHLDLFQTLYVSSVSCNLISLSKLDSVGYFLHLGMDVSVCLNIIILLLLEFFFMIYTN